MKKLLTILLSILMLMSLAACNNSQEEYDDDDWIEIIAEPSDDSEVKVDEVNEEIYYLYEISKNEKINDILNNVPQMINYGGGYPTIMWGDSYFEEYAQAFCEGFAKLQVKKVDSVDVDELKYTINFYWDENDEYNVYFTEGNVALIDDEAYQILDISYIEGILD